MNILKTVFDEVLAGIALVAIGGGLLFIAVTVILLLGKLVRFAWGW